MADRAWFIVIVLKTIGPERGPRVQIPRHPPNILESKATRVSPLIANEMDP